MWRIIQVSFNLNPPNSVHNLFTSWLEGLNRKMKSKILVGASAICWVLWLTRNDIVFDKAIALSYLQVIFKATYWIRFWSLLQKEEDHHSVKIGCRTIETATMQVFARHGWRFSNRIVIQFFHSQNFVGFMAQNFVFEIPWTFLRVFVIMNSHMH